MGAVIKINGLELPEALVIVDTLNGTVEVQDVLNSEKKLDMDRTHTEVNIFGDISLDD